MKVTAEQRKRAAEGLYQLEARCARLKKVGTPSEYEYALAQYEILRAMAEASGLVPTAQGEDLRPVKRGSRMRSRRTT